VAPSPINYSRRHRKIPVIDVEITRMQYERNFVPEFDFIMVDAHVRHYWGSLPKANAGPNIWTHQEMEDKCGTGFSLPLLKFRSEPVVICLRQDSVSPEEFNQVNNVVFYALIMSDNLIHLHLKIRNIQYRSKIVLFLLG